ncbi:MAG: MarR family transcriptional regulator [Clostridium sp.]|uniref:MarR family winged helix-turn-helix transcriptional regulator n=1 Tax=Clostridium sp. TaxID=1506 RepID=UPI0025C43201|nr:MarR family transcriptional regulator [Clostridium sp.]MCH3964498.1 MarR family transcriptional regulator [Clostridium sp.]MCI1714970.1 MarR family transcriptional regulator [Clostridium sp.]MCI1799232.1 MarR family transcriptional regulator [Clostridium sp.]MCI1813153.1 MarR family transcriptional regulator [Clostridium sp.]MCI1870043.1 MarR family transcriptional regulator [Clostridium sp.]
MDNSHYQKELEILDDMHQAYSLLFIAINKIQVEADSHLENLTLRQLMLMIAIAHLEPQEATIIRIANTLGTSKQNVTRLVSCLVKAGYLCSIPSPTDQRSVNISITEEGLSMMRKNTLYSNRYFLDLFKGFTKEEIAAFRRFLEKLVDFDHSRQKHFEEQVEIDIGQKSKDMEKFLEQVHEQFL